ncbi:MAG: type II toxin-antitoxin system RelE/ParE family toxin [Chitinispirillia bacterium]|nr:type II toxin-antitoxin system RelE/ParE family toxin [Chitinispirillia bacterium]
MKYQIQREDTFDAWMEDFKKKHLEYAVRIERRISQIEEGALGHNKSVGGGVSEIKLDFGPGYRVYYTLRGLVVVVLLCGGDKSTQKKDIELARQLAKEISHGKWHYKEKSQY